MRDAAGLQVRGLRAGYGRVEAVRDISLEVSPGEEVAIVGRNGAGKTTALAAIAGLRHGLNAGAVTINSIDISSARPHEIVSCGLSLVPEGRQVFKEMSVLENLRLGAYSHRRRLGSQLAERLDHVFELFPALKAFRLREVASLSGGQQQMVAIGQALMSQPSILLLDEPASGVAPVLVDEIYDRLRQLILEGLGVLIVDQSIERVLEYSDRYYVVDNGSVALAGVSNSDAVAGINRVVLGLSEAG